MILMAATHQGPHLPTESGDAFLAARLMLCGLFDLIKDTNQQVENKVTINMKVTG